MNFFTRLINTITSMQVKEDESESQPVPPVPSPGKSNIDLSKIDQDYSVIERWHRGWTRPLSQITEAVIHHTDGNGNVETLRRWMLGGERKDQYRKGVALFHFAVDRDGKIWKVGPISRWWYHSSSGQHDKLTIGIELIHRSGPFSAKQYNSLSWLLFDYMHHFCGNFNRIVSHDYNNNTYSGHKKGCPGKDFDWKKLEKEMKSRKISFDTHGFEEYTITFPG